MAHEFPSSGGSSKRVMARLVEFLHEVQYLDHELARVIQELLRDSQYLAISKILQATFQVLFLSPLYMG